jgi:hypothetical protein
MTQIWCRRWQQDKLRTSSGKKNSEIKSKINPESEVI